jgi:hypothetical protein
MGINLGPPYDQFQAIARGSVFFGRTCDKEACEICGEPFPPPIPEDSYLPKPLSPRHVVVERDEVLWVCETCSVSLGGLKVMARIP